MARKKAFALDKFFEAMTDKKGIAKGRAIQDWYGEKSDEATMELADTMREMQKKLKGPKGMFKGWQKTLIPLLVGAVTMNPAAGAAVGAMMAGSDLIVKDSRYKQRIEALEKMRTKKGKYAGTFLENYIEQGLSGIKSGTLGGLKGGQKLGRILGGTELLLSLLPGLGEFGKEPAKEVAKEVVKDVTTDIGSEIAENVAEDVAVDASSKLAFGSDIFHKWPAEVVATTSFDDFPVPIRSDILQQQIGTKANYLKDIAKVGNLGTRAVMPELPMKTLLSGVKDLAKGVGGKYAKTSNLLTKPLVPYSGNNFGRSLLSGLTTPSMYTPLATVWDKKRNIGQSEPILQRAPNPYKRWN